MGLISFTDYNKITDTLMFFNQNITLTFCVSLNKKSAKSNEMVNFHHEYHYQGGYSIKRNINMYFCINDSTDFEKSVIIRPQDIPMMRIIFDNGILPWFMNKRIFTFDDKKQLVIKGRWSRVDFPLNEYSFLSFEPCVITYQDGMQKEGVRLTINDNSNYIDIAIDKFMEFYYYISNTDMYNAAIGLLNYVKSQTETTNLMDLRNNNDGQRGYEDFDGWDVTPKSSKKRNTFFDNL